MKAFSMSKTSPIVETPKGKLRGFHYDGVDHFYGIRYAKAKRFQMPEPIPAWEGVKDAGSYGMNCPVLSEPHARWRSDDSPPVLALFRALPVLKLVDQELRSQCQAAGLVLDPRRRVLLRLRH